MNDELKRRAEEWIADYDGPATDLIRELRAECQRLTRIAHGGVQEVERLEGRIAELEAQLPEGLKRCTIKFVECEVGHGRLIAKNWIDHGCPWCRIAELERQPIALQQRCVEMGIYVRAPDDHWIEPTVEQAEDLLRDAVGVDCRIAELEQSAEQPKPEPASAWPEHVQSLIDQLAGSPVAHPKPSCICDGASYHTDLQAHPFIVNAKCPVHAEQPKPETLADTLRSAFAKHTLSDIIAALAELNFSASYWLRAEQPKPKPVVWRDVAEHLRHCVECSESDVNECFEGSRLWKLAESAPAPAIPEPKPEPVAWVMPETLKWFFDRRRQDGSGTGFIYSAELGGTVPLYTAPPAIPDGYELVRKLTYEQQCEIGQRYGVTSVVVEQVLSAAKVQP